MRRILVFALIPLILSMGITPALSFDNAFALTSKGTSISSINSNKVCGDQLCSVINAMPTPPKGQIVIPENEKQEDNPDAQLLFVQTSVSGTFLEKDGRQILTLVGISPTTAYFSDRPDRISGFMLTDVFAALWGEGEDSFADDPPNAALELLDWDEQSDVFIIELYNPVYDYDAEILQYDVIILEEGSEGLSQYNKYNDPKIPATFEHAVLFIDDADLDSVLTSNAILIPGVSQFYGVDITKGISEDNLVPFALFDFDDDNTIEIQIGDSNYLVPESLVFDSTDKYDMKSHTYTSIKDLSHSLSVEAGLSYSSPQVDAEVDANYSQESSSSESSYFATVDAFDRKYKLTVKSGLEATHRFQNAVDNLPSQYAGNQEDYFNFFSTFGTHYTNFVEYGGIMHYWSQESDIGSMTAEEFEVSVSATVNELVGSVSGSLDVSGSSSKSKSTSDISVSITGYGGDSSLLGAYLTQRSPDSFDDWWASIDDDPGQMGINYNEIYNLVTDSHKKTQLKNALNDYIRSDFGYQIFITNSDNYITTTVSIGTNGYNTETITYPNLYHSSEKGGVMVISDATTGKKVHTEKINETHSGKNTIAEFNIIINQYEKKGNNYIYFIGMFTEFTSADQSNFLWFEKIGASPFTDLPIGESNYYMLVGQTNLAEGYGQDKWLTAETVSLGTGYFAETNCEFSGSIAKTVDGFTEISVPSLSNCTVPSSQFVQSLDVYITTDHVSLAGTNDKVTITLGGLDFDLSGHGKKLNKGRTDHYGFDTTGKHLELYTITDVKIHKAKDSLNGGWKLKGIKILADGTEIYNNQSIHKWLQNHKRTWSTTFS